MDKAAKAAILKESLEYSVLYRLSRLMSEERHHRLSAQQLRSSSLLDTFLPSTTARDSLPSSILPRSVTSVTLHEKWCRLWLWIDDIKVEMWINSVMNIMNCGWIHWIHHQFSHELSSYDCWEELGACPPLGYWDPFGMMAFQDEEKFRQSKNCRMEWEKVVNQATRYILIIYSIYKLHIIHICLWLVMLRHLGVFSFLTCLPWSGVTASWSWSMVAFAPWRAWGVWRLMAVTLLRCITS